MKSHTSARAAPSSKSAETPLRASIAIVNPAGIRVDRKSHSSEDIQYALRLTPDTTCGGCGKESETRNQENKKLNKETKDSKDKTTVINAPLQWRTILEHSV